MLQKNHSSHRDQERNGLSSSPGILRGSLQTSAKWGPGTVPGDWIKVCRHHGLSSQPIAMEWVCGSSSSQVGQCLETFLILMVREGMLLASCE